jgi:CheY-like chemotaxis protein
MSERSLTILHIEDDHVDKMVIERVIKRLNITNNILHASNGEEALELLRGENGKSISDPLPNVILLDIKGITGRREIMLHQCICNDNLQRRR